MGPDMNPRTASPSETLAEYLDGAQSLSDRMHRPEPVRDPEVIHVRPVVRRFRLGERVQEVEQIGGVCKVVKVHPDGTYLVREFAHPHRIVRVDGLHLSRPTGRHHDKVADRMLDDGSSRG